MSRLIDADEVLKSCVDEKGNYLGHDAAVVGEAVSAAPTVDAVAVCRCKDCVHSVLDECGHRFCDYTMGGSDVGDLFFCADGERKGGDENEKSV